MISQCMNPSCHCELHYLRSGRVVRITHGTAPVQVEHFWLCGECNRNYDFRFSPDGAVTLKQKPIGCAESPLMGSMVA